MGIGSLRVMSYPTSMGFEPTRGDPNGLAVHRLNRSATMSSTFQCLHPSDLLGSFGVSVYTNVFHLSLWWPDPLIISSRWQQAQVTYNQQPPQSTQLVHCDKQVNSVTLAGTLSDRTALPAGPARRVLLANA